MKNILLKLSLAASLLFGTFMLSACDNNKDVEDVADNVGDTLDDAAEEVGDAAEEFGDEVEDATN